MENNKMNVEGKITRIFRCGVDIRLPLRKQQYYHIGEGKTENAD